ncbi:hypothetical protein E4T42_09305 [Aureobasidium subglaciale]|nr:hypothetical protein E4T42_09305 [Aureobasidium subglaciale]
MTKPLNVTIIGAGLAGLLAARVLREDHNVTVLEKWSGGAELGAAINMGPNGTKIAKALGFIAENAGSLSASMGIHYNEKGDVTFTNQFGDLKATFGGEWYFQHRADLWDEFHRLATASSADLGISGQPASILWGCEVIDLNVESGLVKLADGREFESDLVVGADGIKSLVRLKVVGDEAFRTARPSGSSAFRFTLPRDVVASIDPDFRAINATKPASLQIYEGVGRQVVVYPCRNFDLVNVGCIASDKLIGHETTESWSATGSKEDLLRVYDGFDPKLLSFFKQAKDIRLWQLRDQDPLPTYIKGRTVIIGDAAHAMTPHQGQGGNQAIEDAEGFFLFKGQNVDRTTVPDILRDFDRVRRERASTIQNHTRDQHGRKDPSKMWKYTQYNFTYPGVRECVARLNAGKEMIDV